MDACERGEGFQEGRGGERERERWGERSRERGDQRKPWGERKREAAGDGESDAGGAAFFACYLLSSQSPRHKGRTYIGFTVNPRRRIRQHNGEIGCGAWRTRRGRPWEMVLCIYGFPSNVSALQFEWAWQHPTESLAVRKAASTFKSFSGVGNKIKIAYTMLTLPYWENLYLTVNFFSTKYMMHLGGCPRLPKQMKVNVCIMDELPCYVEGQTSDCNDSDEIDYEREKINEDVDPANRIEEDARSSEISSSCDLYISKESNNCPFESPCLVESPKPDERYEIISEIPESTSETPCSFRDENSCEWLQQSNLQRRPSSLRSSKNDSSTDSLLISPVLETKAQNFCIDDESNVISLSTPSSCIVEKRNKRAKVHSDIIDLTDSPVTIQQ
ncbi:structure-specific endonuclease subunit SLX1 homolog 2-like [Asparagus officinalis]|uniref:structure-specific endonuclease subunit SLX1 homolog 2-like n=1 Tax=Asparagus officinalis TaxID=4686 RepID=UPI00098DF1E5|nr:structure-specific endonuclease subunit SLX1 homolog 2-like [Asparagus officinalis]